MSTSDAICWSAWSAAAVGVRLVNRAVTPLGLQEVDLRVSIADTSAAAPDAQQVGDRVHDDHGGLELADELLHRERGAPRGRAGSGGSTGTAAGPASTHAAGRCPTDAMLRTISASDSSKAK